MKPDYVNLNLFYSKGAHDFALQVANKHLKPKKTTLKLFYQSNISKQFWYKTGIDTHGNQENYVCFDWNGVKFGFSNQLSLKNSDDFTGYLDYPFNWGVSIGLQA